MNKKELVSANSKVRNACERSNANLARTARTFDHDVRGFRPTTDKEREERIMDAWLWAMEAQRLAAIASSLALEYAKQNGITVKQIDAHTRRRAA